MHSLRYASPHKPWAFFMRCDYCVCVFRYLGSDTTCTSQSNNITTLPSNVFSSLSKLSTLYMRCLPIQTLPADTFTPLPSSTSVFW